MPRSDPLPAVMRDVARAAGVHQTTVSRALRNDPRIPEATRRRIQRIAANLNYRPHPLVSALIAVRRARRRPSFPVTLAFLAHVSRDDHDYQPHQYTYEAHLAGAQAAAEEQGYQVQLFPINSPGMTEQRLNEILFARNIPGVIIGALPQAHGRFALDWPRYCTAVIEYTFTVPELDRVVHDSYAGMRRIMAECRKRGLRRVGLLLTAAGDERTEYLNGAAYWIEQKAAEAFDAIPPLIVPDWNGDAFAEWRERHRLEVAVTSNALLPGLIDWCGARGLRVGTDLSIINVNAEAQSAIAGIYQDSFTIGATAARMVIEKIGRNDRGVPALRQTILTSGRWVEGPSLSGAAPKAVKSRGISAEKPKKRHPGTVAVSGSS
jgi:LacI family transcriptional regulator/LacI family fructose operon transcriptional repressor